MSLINSELKCSSDTSICTLSLPYGNGYALNLCYKCLFFMPRWFTSIYMSLAVWKVLVLLSNLSSFFIDIVWCTNLKVIKKQLGIQGQK
ncbi:hypothetical protein F8B92_25050 [Escherichia coli]|nr:hypothetical protein [Escherichia coli]